MKIWLIINFFFTYLITLIQIFHGYTLLFQSNNPTFHFFSTFFIPFYSFFIPHTFILLYPSLPNPVLLLMSLDFLFIHDGQGIMKLALLECDSIAFML